MNEKYRQQQRARKRVAAILVDKKKAIKQLLIDDSGGQQKNCFHFSSDSFHFFSARIDRHTICATHLIRQVGIELSIDSIGSVQPLNRININNLKRANLSQHRNISFDIFLIYFNRTPMDWIDAKKTRLFRLFVRSMKFQRRVEYNNTNFRLNMHTKKEYFMFFGHDSWIIFMVFKFFSIFKLEMLYNMKIAWKNFQFPNRRIERTEKKTHEKFDWIR